MLSTLLLLFGATLASAMPAADKKSHEKSPFEAAAARYLAHNHTKVRLCSMLSISRGAVYFSPRHTAYLDPRKAYEVGSLW